MIASRRLGILGGTFDPIHFGHLDAADAARRALQLDRVLLIPSFDPPHRPADPMASGFHRFALVALAIQGDDALSASDMELTRTGPSYTADTLRAVARRGMAAIADFLHSRQRRIRRNRHVARVPGRARHSELRRDRASRHHARRCGRENIGAAWTPAVTRRKRPARPVRLFFSWRRARATCHRAPSAPAWLRGNR